MEVNMLRESENKKELKNALSYVPFAARVRACAHTHTCVWVRRYKYIDGYRQGDGYKYIYVYMYVSTYIHVCVCVNLKPVTGVQFKAHAIEDKPSKFP